MVRRYLREIICRIGNDNEALEIRNLRIQFRVRKDSSQTFSEGDVRIFNLQPENERRIQNRGERIELLAGYQGDVGLLYSGSIKRVERGKEVDVGVDLEENQIKQMADTSRFSSLVTRSGLNRVTDVSFGGFVDRQNVATFDHSYQEDISLRTFVADLVETLGLEVGNLSLIPANAIEVGPPGYTGPTRPKLKQLLKSRGLRGYEENGRFHVTRIGDSTDDRRALNEVVAISEATGMIGTPTLTDDGMRVETQLDRRITLDTRVRVVSTLVDSGQIWKIVLVEHEGDNWEGDFKTRVEGRYLD